MTNLSRKTRSQWKSKHGQREERENKAWRRKLRLPGKKTGDKERVEELGMAGQGDLEWGKEEIMSGCSETWDWYRKS